MNWQAFWTLLFSMVGLLLFIYGASRWGEYVNSKPSNAAAVFWIGVGTVLMCVSIARAVA